MLLLFNSKIIAWDYWSLEKQFCKKVHSRNKMLWFSQMEKVKTVYNITLFLTMQQEGRTSYKLSWQRFEILATVL
jgi:hypothetical protein